MRAQDAMAMPIASAAALIVFVFIVMLIAIWYLMVPSTRARAAEMYRVPEVCKPLASKYHIPDLVTAGQAQRLVGELDRYSWWPGVKQCRMAVQREWKL